MALLHPFQVVHDDGVTAQQAMVSEEPEISGTRYGCFRKVRSLIFIDGVGFLIELRQQFLKVPFTKHV